MEAANLAIAEMKEQHLLDVDLEMLENSHMEDLMNENPSLWGKIKKTYRWLKGKLNKVLNRKPESEQEIELELEEYRANAVEDLRAPLIDGLDDAAGMTNREYVKSRTPEQLQAIKDGNDPKVSAEQLAEYMRNEQQYVNSRTAEQLKAIQDGSDPRMSAATEADHR